MTATEQDAAARDQKAVLAFLGGKDGKCERIDTHASIVFRRGRSRSPRTISSDQIARWR
jgi:hypothetical protein